MPLYNYVERKNLFKPSMELLELTTEIYCIEIDRVKKKLIIIKETTIFESSQSSCPRPSLFAAFIHIQFHLNFLITRANNNGDTSTKPEQKKQHTECCQVKWLSTCEAIMV